MTALEKKVWAEWNSLSEPEKVDPVRAIARNLGMTPADVAFIVYPAETFGPWSDDDEF